MKIHDLFEMDGDQSELPTEKFDAIMHELQELSKDHTRSFASALAMVHEAYRICDIERPSPSMKGAWTQYEKAIQAAVQYLGKNNPDGNWRLTSAGPKTPPK